MADVQTKAMSAVSAVFSLFVPVVAVVWVMALPQRLGLLIYPEQVVVLMLGAALVVVFCRSTASDTAAWRLLNAALACIAGVLSVYVYIRFPVLSEATHRFPTETLLIGIGVTLLTLVASLPVAGWTRVVLFARRVGHARCRVRSRGGRWLQRMCCGSSVRTPLPSGGKRCRSQPLSW